MDNFASWKFPCPNRLARSAVHSERLVGQGPPWSVLKYLTSERKLRSSSQHLLATPKARLKTYGERERFLWRHRDYGTRSHLN